VASGVRAEYPWHELVRSAKLEAVTPVATWPSTLAPGKGAKFTVVDSATGYRSSTWHVWTGKNADQVFLQELATGPAWKVSHHNEPSRTTGLPAWRIAMTQEEADNLDIERVVIDHWVPDTPDQGWIEGVGVLIPFAYLRPSTEALSTSVVQVQSHHACSAYSVHLYLEEVGAIGLAFSPGLPIAVLERRTGGRVYVLATPEHLGPRQFDALAMMRAEAQADRSDTLTYPTDRFVGVLKLLNQRVLADLTLN
jgi:hypothetical protein